MAYQTVYSDPQQVAAPDLYTAFKAAVAQYAFPLLPADCIRRGLLNDVSLPQQNDFAVITVLDRRRIGTNQKSYTQPPEGEEKGTITELTLWEASVQISFFSDTYQAGHRAEALQTFIRGMVGAAHFRQYGIGSAYCDNMRLLDQKDGQGRQTQHAIVTAHVQFYSGIAAQLPFTDGYNVILRPLY